MSPDSAVVAVVGLGRMGRAIAARLIEAGHPVCVHNRTPGPEAPLVELGARAAATPAAAAEGAAVVVSCLLDDAAVEAVAAAPDGLLAGLAPGAVHVSTSTVSPGCSAGLAARHAERGQRFLAAPVVGRPDVARAGRLISLVGGPGDVLQDARPVVEGYSARVLHAGTDPGTANSLKLGVNFYIASMIELFGQVLTFAEARGVDHDTAMEALRAMQGHPGVAGYLERIGARDFAEAGFAMPTGLKDLGLVLDAAAEVRCPVPFAGLVRDHILTAMATGLEHRDWAALTEVTRRGAGLG